MVFIIYVIFEMYLLSLLVSFWNLSVHVFIKLILSELIYF